MNTRIKKSCIAKVDWKDQSSRVRDLFPDTIDHFWPPDGHFGFSACSGVPDVAAFQLVHY